MKPNWKVANECFCTTNKAVEIRVFNYHTINQVMNLISSYKNEDKNTSNEIGVWHLKDKIPPNSRYQPQD